MNQYLIAANSKRAQLIFNIFRPIDLIILGVGGVITMILFFIVQPSELIPAIITLLPLMVCAFLVIPVANYHNMLCVIQNIYHYYITDINQYVWKGWGAKDEYK